MQAPGDAFLAGTLKTSQEDGSILREYFTWTEGLTKDRTFSDKNGGLDGEYYIKPIDEGLSGGLYLEFDVLVENRVNFFYLCEFPPTKRDAPYTHEWVRIFSGGAIGRYKLEMRPEFIRWSVNDGETQSLPIPTKPTSSTAPIEEWVEWPRYWVESIFIPDKRIGSNIDNISIYFIAAGEVKPKPFWTDGRGCNYVIQAGVNR